MVFMIRISEKLLRIHDFPSFAGHTALRLANVFIGLLYLFVGGDMGTTFALALVYLIVFTPLSYLFWFRPIYKAFRDDSSISFMAFFFVFFFQMLVSILRALGWGMGSTGIILGLQTVSAGASGGLIFVGILMIIDGVGFGIAALADFYVLTRVRNLDFSAEITDSSLCR